MCASLKSSWNVFSPISIGPKTGGIGLFDFHRAREAIELGARAAEKQIDEIKMAVRALAA